MDEGLAVTEVGEEIAKEQDERPATGQAPSLPVAADPPPSEAADSLQDSRDPQRAVPSNAQPRGAQSRELELQELPTQTFVSPYIPGQDSISRLRKLHAEMDRIVQRHEQEEASVQSWGAWLWQFCTLGNLLQAACSGVLVLSLLISREESNTNLVVALILCSSMVLLLWVQHVTFQRRVMELCSRARRFLSRLEWYLKNPIEASTLGAHVAGGTNVWLQTSRPISSVQVISNNGYIALPTQLLVSGDRVALPTDHWLVEGYCERSEINDAIVRDTPSATQLDRVLSQPRRPYATHFEDQTCLVFRRVLIKWTLTCALMVSMLSSIILCILHPELTSTVKSALNLLIVRHVSVCLPLLPISVFLSSVVLQVVCNAYLAAKIQYKYNLRTGTSADPTDDNEDEFDRTQVSGLKMLLEYIPSSLRRTRSGGTGSRSSESDNVAMITADSEADRLPRKGLGPRKDNSKSRFEGELNWRSVMTHVLQRLTMPTPDQDRALDVGIINPCADLVDALGCATVLCFPDVDGVVCEPLMSAKQILLLSPDPKATDSDAASVKVIELLGAEKGAPIGACTFQDADAIEQYISQLKPLGLNCLLNTNAHSDAYTTFIECTLRDMIYQKQMSSVHAVGSIVGGLGGNATSRSAAGVGGGSGMDGQGAWIRSDAYVDMVSCDSCDASYLLAPIIGFSAGVATTFDRLLELQILVRSSAPALPQELRQRRSSCGTPGSTSLMPIQRRNSMGTPGSSTHTHTTFLPPPPQSVSGSDAGGAAQSLHNRVEQSPHLMGVVVEDPQKQMQVFTKGDVDAVLAHCSHMWDGQELRRLTPEHVNLIRQHCSECYQKHYRCVAFSYLSLGSEKRDLIRQSSQLGRCVFLDQDDMGNLTMLGASDWELDAGAQAGAQAGADAAAGPSAFSWRRPKAQPTMTLASISEDLLQDHIFIGMLTMRHRPYSEMTESIDVLSEAGIRFVFFSEMQEPPTVAFGNQLGLWSDWNCCISLRDLPPPPRSIPPTPPGSGISRQSHINRNANYSHASAPRLPHGIQSIRRHILEADDVPLRVSMFCDSSPETITSMVTILQENGECVVSCGSSRNAHNMQLFAAADLSMSIDPQPPSRQGSLMYGEYWNGVDTELPGGVTSVPCALNMNRNFSMEELIDYTATSRTLLDGVRQASQFGLCISLMLMSVALISNLIMLPPVLEPMQIIRHLVLIAPCFLCAILFSTQRISTRVKSENPMRRKPLKRERLGGASFWMRPETRWQAIYIAIRCIPTSLVLIVVFMDCLSQSLLRYQSIKLNVGSGQGMGAGSGPSDIDPLEKLDMNLTTIIQLSAHSETHQLSEASSLRFNLALVEARQMVDIDVVVAMAVLSIGSLHRTASFLDLWRHCKYIWLCAVLAAAIIQCSISTVVLSAACAVGELCPALENVPPSVIALTTIWPFVILFVDMALRHHDRIKVRRLQQKLTLEFETLLGQTSPK